MSKTRAFSEDFLQLIFNATAIANIADNAGTAPATDLAISLHTASPGETGDATTSETTYTGYSRVNVSRASGAGGWTVATGVDPASVSPTDDTDFGECTASPGGALTHFGISIPGGNVLLYYGTLTPNIAMSTGVIPRIKNTSTITED